MMFVAHSADEVKFVLTLDKNQDRRGERGQTAKSVVNSGLLLVLGLLCTVDEFTVA